MTPTNYIDSMDKETGEIVINWFNGEDTLERRLLPIPAPYTIVWMPEQSDWALYPNTLPFGAIPFAGKFRD